MTTIQKLLRWIDSCQHSGHLESCKCVANFGSPTGESYRTFDPDLADCCDCGLAQLIQEANSVDAGAAK